MPTVIKFPKTIAAAREAERVARANGTVLWRLGDALVEECGPPGQHGVNNKAHAGLGTVAAELERQGLKRFSLVYLRKLRQTSAWFTHDNRLSSVCWTAHHEAGDPKTLTAAQKQAEKDEAELTAAFVKQFRREQRNKQRDQTDQPASDDNPDVLSAIREALDAATRAQAHAAEFRERIETLREGGSLTSRVIAELTAAVHATVSDWSRCRDALGGWEGREAAE